MPENFHELVSDLIVNTKGSGAGSFWSWTADSSLAAFAPELILCATIVLMLLVRLWGSGIVGRILRGSAFYIALIGTLLALFSASPWQHLGPAPSAAALQDPTTVWRMEIFTGMLVYDTFSVYVRALLLFFTVLFILLTKLTGIPDREDAPDIYTLVLGAIIGMCLMASANHLLMVFMSVEMASVPSYVLAGMLKGRRLGSEAALKYSVYGAGAAGVMLYGISLVAGLLNTAHLPTMAVRLAQMLDGISIGDARYVVLGLGALMIMVGLAFKLSAVPFHFWCPDVFEGATAEVNAFLSVASKAAALALLVRVAIGLGAVPPAGPQPGQRSALIARESSDTEEGTGEQTTLRDVDSTSSGTEMYVSYMADETVADDATSGARQQAMQRLSPARDFIGKMIALFAVITCTFGNLAAYGQTNIKRLMAYSTIAHAGYMMMPVPVVMVMAELDPSIARDAVAALCIYMGVYLFMNLGVFAIIAFLRNSMRTEQIADYAGLIRRNPLIVICLGIILFSLIGLPPLAGFIGKFAVFASLADGWRSSVSSGNPANYLLLVLVLGGVNTVISLFYYLRVVKVMALDPEPQDRTPFESTGAMQGLYVVFTAAATVVLFFAWNPLNLWAQAAARYLL